MGINYHTLAHSCLLDRVDGSLTISLKNPKSETPNFVPDPSLSVTHCSLILGPMPARPTPCFPSMGNQYFSFDVATRKIEMGSFNDGISLQSRTRSGIATYALIPRVSSVAPVSRAIHACVMVASMQMWLLWRRTTRMKEYCRPSFSGAMWIVAGPTEQRVMKVRALWIACGWSSALAELERVK